MNHPTSTPHRASLLPLSSSSPRRRSCRAGAVVLAVFVALATGCASFRINTPQGFAQLANQTPAYDYRAASAYGVAVSVRAVANREHAPLDFWAEVVDRHLQRSGPYALRASAPVRTASGLAGRRLEYTYSNAGASSTYWATVFVTTDKVYVVEAGGLDSAFDRARASVERSLQSFTAL